MKAVVAHALNEFSVVDVDLDPPKAGEVLVRMRATGVCHSDLYHRGQLDRMVTRTYRIDEAPQAFEDLEGGINARGVIVYD